jgi:hypothetical protein
MLSTGVPNFRIHAGVFQVAVPTRINVIGIDQTVIAQVRGDFAKEGNVYVLKPAEFYIGSCPIHFFPWLPDFLMRRFLSTVPVPDAVVVAWKNLSSVRVDGSTLQLTMP